MLGGIVGAVEIIAANGDAGLPFKYWPPSNKMRADFSEISQFFYKGFVIAITQKDNAISAIGILVIRMPVLTKLLEGNQ